MVRTAAVSRDVLNPNRRYLDLGVLASTLAIVYGIWYSYGVIMVALLREFGWSRSVLAGAFSVFTLAHGLANPVIGWLCGRVAPARVVIAGALFLAAALVADSFVAAPWQLYLAFGLCTATGVAASGWVPALVMAQRRFPDRLGLALGIVSAGVGLGMLLVVPLCQVLIDAFGWRTTFRALAALCVAWAIPAALYILRTSRAARSDTRSAAHAERSAESAPAGRGLRRTAFSLGGATRTPVFWLIMSAWLLGNVCTQTLHVHQVVYLVDHGIAPIVAATIVSVVGAASIVAKIGGGWISDWIDREIVYVAGMVIVVGAVCVLALLGLRAVAWAAYVYAILLGVGYSVTASLIPAMASDRFGGPHFGAIVGLGLLASALGSAVGPWFAGWLFDRTGSYGASLAIAAGCAGAAGAAAWRLRTLRLRAQQTSSENAA